MRTILLTLALPLRIAEWAKDSEKVEVDEVYLRRNGIKFLSPQQRDVQRVPVTPVPHQRQRTGVTLPCLTVPTAGSYALLAGSQSLMTRAFSPLVAGCSVNSSSFRFSILNTSVAFSPEPRTVTRTRQRSHGSFHLSAR